MLKGRFLLHCSDPKNWKLRPQNHPCDPCWESGMYSICHPKIRPHISVGTIIFDVVVRNGKAVIRSAFQVSDKRDSTLFFDEFFFSGEEPIKLEGYFIQYRGMKLSTYTKKSPWKRIVREYPKYRKGERPHSIALELWKNMIKMCKDANAEHQKRQKECTSSSRQRKTC